MNTIKMLQPTVVCALLARNIIKFGKIVIGPRQQSPYVTCAYSLTNRVPKYASVGAGPRLKRADKEVELVGSPPPPPPSKKDKKYRQMNDNTSTDTHVHSFSGRYEQN
jgi:hypothetical protein